MKRISFTESDVALLHDLMGTLKDRVRDMPKGDHVVEAMRRSIDAKTDVIEKILKGGVIENE
jgi:hypothetical protein